VSNGGTEVDGVGDGAPHPGQARDFGRYLETWAAILSLGRFPAIAYVDGFAGPGVYEKGEIGSPIIALNAALEQQRKHPKMAATNLIFLFVEQKKDRAERLQECVDALQVPSNFRVKIVGETSFEAGFRKNLLDWYRSRGQSLPPTFAFIDPFGWTGVPFGLVKEILAYDSCEVLFNFMYEEINRFIEHPDQTKNFHDLFGTDAWQAVGSITDPPARRAFFHDLYVRQLRQAAGARYVRSFEMANKNDATDYFLFFATNNRKGIQKMKEAMWKIDESGAFRFSDATAGAAQLSLPLTAKPHFAALKRDIVNRFAGHVATVAEIEEFVLADTPFRETHYKKHVLAELERSGVVVPVEPEQGRRAGTYGTPGMKLRFSPTIPVSR
jgi:three-Cys-motif partner protein